MKRRDFLRSGAQAAVEIATTSPYVSTLEGPARPAMRWRLEGRRLQILAKAATHEQ